MHIHHLSDDLMSEWTIRDGRPQRGFLQNQHKMLLNKQLHFAFICHVIDMPMRTHVN